MATADILPLLEPIPATSNSDTHHISRLKGYPIAFKSRGTQHEYDMMNVAGECSVKAHGRILAGITGSDKPVEMRGFTMDLATPLVPQSLDHSRHEHLMNQIIEVVLALHTKGIVHGDMKLANMLICADGRVCLCDFAEARMVDEDLLVWDGVATEHYVSPDRFSRDWPDNLTGQRKLYPPMIECDLYGLGLSIWELHTGKPAFEGMGHTDLDDWLIAGKTVDVDEVEEKSVRDIIRRYLWR